MKIYFSTSATNLLNDIAKNRKKINYLIDSLEKEGHTVFKRTLLRGHDVSPDIQKKKAGRFFEYIDGNTSDVYKSNINKIKSADIAIFESTYPAEGIGYEIGFALNQKKPVLILVDKTYKTFLAEMIEGMPSNLKQLVYYEREEELDEVIKEFTKKAKGMIDSKFIMIITPEIDRYFQWAKKNKRLHKAQIVRNSVFRQMEDDPEWRDFNETE